MPSLGHLGPPEGSNPRLRGQRWVPLRTWGEGQSMDGVFLGPFQGESASLFLDAATLEELEWVIRRQMKYYDCERRHSRLGYRSPMEYLVNERSRVGPGLDPIWPSR